MFRAVCMKHRCLLNGVPGLIEAGAGSFNWDLGIDEVTCPAYDKRFQEIEDEVYGTLPVGISLFDYVWPVEDPEQGAKAQKMKDDEACMDRWYVVDGAGYLVHMMPHESDKQAFARIDTFQTWRQNLGIES